MFYCAYELDFPRLEELKNELREFYPSQPATWQASEYLNYKQVGPETARFYELFDNCFLNNMRFLRAPADTYYGPHIDIDAHELDHFEGEIPPNMARNATINILLGDPDPTVTKWYIDLEAKKYDWKTHRDIAHKMKLKVVDEYSLGEPPILFNTGQWHSVKYTKERWMAGFHFHPFVTWQGAVEYCREKGFLIER